MKDPVYAQRRRELDRLWAQNYRAKNPKARDEAQRRYVEKNKGDGKGRVYFIQAQSGPIKIGHTTKTPAARMRELQIGSHEDLKILATQLGTVLDERNLHRRFVHLLIRREWFKPAPELLSYITTLL